MEKIDEPDQQLNKLITKVKLYLKEMNNETVEEWQHIIILKCKQLKAYKQYRRVKQSLRLLVYVCDECRIQYNRLQVEEIIKSLYFE